MELVPRDRADNNKRVTTGYMLAIETTEGWTADLEHLRDKIQDYMGSDAKVDIERMGPIDCYEGGD